jgi:hypothetical protein
MQQGCNQYTTFIALTNEFCLNGLITNGRKISIEQKLMIYFKIVGQSASLRSTMDRFQHSLSTISRQYFLIFFTDFNTHYQQYPGNIFMIIPISTKLRLQYFSARSIAVLTWSILVWSFLIKLIALETLVSLSFFNELAISFKINAIWFVCLFSLLIFLAAAAFSANLAFRDSDRSAPK